MSASFRQRKKGLGIRDWGLDFRAALTPTPTPSPQSPIPFQRTNHDRANHQRQRRGGGDPRRAEPGSGRPEAAARHHAGAGDGAGRREPGLGLLRHGQGQGLRRTRHEVASAHAPRRDQRGGSAQVWSISSTATPRSTASWFSSRCPSTSTRPRSSTPSIRTRTSTASTRSTSAGW